MLPIKVLNKKVLNETDIKTLCKVFTFWNAISNDEREMIVSNTISVTYDMGQNIHSGENDCVGVLVVKQGELRTYILSEEGKEITLYRLYAGDVCMLSASCVLKNITFDVHIDAQKKSEILLINSAIFQKLISQNIIVENFALKSTVDRFSDVMWAMEQILFMSMDKRLAIFLIDEASKNKSDIINLTHEQIAKYMGSAREVVSRMLKYFEREGLVELSRGGIKITDKESLRALI